MEEKQIDVPANLDAEGVSPTLRKKKAERANAGSKPRALRPRSELELLSEISAKLDRVIAVLAAQGKDRDTQVAILAAAGCESTFVGRIVGITPGAVRNLPGWRRSLGGAASVTEASL